MSLQYRDAAHIPHACVVCASSPEESYEAARELAAALVCGGPDPVPCGCCSACRKLREGIHPDVITIRREKDSQGRLRREILVDQVRAMAADAVVLPNESPRKVYLIYEADRMNLQAQNAALKLLEEPPGGVYFLLCVCNPSLLLETVRSRCARIDRRGVSGESEERQLAGEYLALVAGGDRVALLEWCGKNEGMDLRAAPDFFEALRALLADMLAGRVDAGGLSAGTLLRLTELCALCLQYLRVNVAVKQIFGLLAVDSIAGSGN